MINIELKTNDSEVNPIHQAGIDVGAEELVLVVRKNSKLFNPQTFTNTRADRTRLVNKLVKLPGVIVCMEATGVYHFDLAVALHDAGVLVMVINPKSSHNFAKVLMKNSKTDAVDANTLAEYAARMILLPGLDPATRPLLFAVFLAELRP